MSEHDRFNTLEHKTPDRGTEFGDGDRIDTSPDNLSVPPLDRERVEVLGRRTTIEAMKFERVRVPTEPERVSAAIGDIGLRLTDIRGTVQV